MQLIYIYILSVQPAKQDVHYNVQYSHVFKGVYNILMSHITVMNCCIWSLFFLCKATKYLYYKRVDPYLWTELASVLEGSVSRRRHPRRPCLCRIRCTCRSSNFLLFIKNGFVEGVRSLNVTADH